MGQNGRKETNVDTFNVTKSLILIKNAVRIESLEFFRRSRWHLVFFVACTILSFGIVSLVNQTEFDIATFFSALQKTKTAKKIIEEIDSEMLSAITNKKKERLKKFRKGNTTGNGDSSEPERESQIVLLFVWIVVENSQTKRFYVNILSGFWCILFQPEPTVNDIEDTEKKCCNWKKATAHGSYRS